MRVCYVLLLLAIVVSASAQQKDNRIVIGTIDTVYSKILNEKRAIYIHVPNGDKSKHYPVLYILDGESHFQSAVAITDQISGIIPELIIVGITNTNREHDLTPTHVGPDRIVNPSEAKETGGGENFTSFIEKELIPYVDAHYSTTSYRVISGHSLGGLTVLNTFFNHTGLFNAYISIDPSLWWEHSHWIERYENELSRHNFNNKGLFVAIANNFPAGLDTLSVLKDTTFATSFSRSVLGFVQSLRNTKPAGLRWSSKFYPNEWHGSVELNAEYDALRYLFKFYHFDMNNFRAHPDMNADSLLKVHYDKLSETFGYKILPDEDMVNSMAYTSMGIGKMNVAYGLFIRNTRDYPQSANAWDSLGEFYEGKGERQKAIEAYTKSLSLQETEDTRRKLNNLKGKK